MPKKTVADIDVKGKRVLMRADFNVPLDGATITDDRRIVQAMPTIKSIVERGGRLILMSHLGRPKGGPDAKYSLKPVADRLIELLAVCQSDPRDGVGRASDDRAHSDVKLDVLKRQPSVTFANDCIGPTVEKLANEMRDGDVLLLENLRFHKEEEKNEPNFARQIAKMADVYVNDAFGTAHREHASTFGVPQALQGKPRVIGFLIQKELTFLGEAVTDPQRPFVAILGGAKVSDKISVIENLLGKADTLLIGGAMAYTFFLAQGKEVGKSLVERDKVELAKSLIAKAGSRLKLPIDTIVAPSIDSTETTAVEGTIPADLSGFDIGPKTTANYVAEIARAKTVLWNGPMGVFEKPQFEAGTKRVAQAVADATQKSHATTIIGGGDSAAAVEQMHLSDQVSHVSTGGGASLEFLENGHFATLDILD